MPSHMSDVGFPLETQNDFAQLAIRTCGEGQPLRTSDGSYIRWSVGGGIELWAQLDQHDEIIGLNPHFRGKGRMRVGLVDEINRPDGTVLDGALYGWANPSDDVLTDGNFPFAFDVPNYKLSGARMDSVVTAQLAAFAHELQAFRTEEAYDESQGGKMKFASRSFIPSGLFTPEGADITPPEANAIFTGHVLETSLVTNPVTGITFWWALVSTLGGEVDVVADPVLLNDEITNGGVVTGSFWLSGVLID